MAKPNNSKTGGNDSGLNFEAQVWAAAEQAVPAPSSRINYTALKLARVNLAICRSRGQGWLCASTPRNAGSFRTDLHPDLKADFVPVRKDLANPPFNMSDWGGENLRQDVRWKFAMPSVNKVNYAWIQLFLHHLGALRDALLPKLLSGELRVPLTANAAGDPVVKT